MIFIRRADQIKKPVVLQLLNNYFEEMFDIQGLSAERRAQLGPYPYFDEYWEEEGRIPYIFQKDEADIGFAFIRETDCFEVAEFFVSQGFRREKLGKRAAFKLFDTHPGNWKIAVMEQNTAAISF